MVFNIDVSIATSDLVLIDVTNPFGFGFLLPRGLLREPVKNLRRADLVILTRCDHVDPATLSKIERRNSTSRRKYSDSAKLSLPFIITAIPNNSPKNQ